MKANTEPLGAAARLATLCQSGAASQTVWSSLDAVLGEVFGHKLFTVLLFDGAGERVVRVYSSRPEINPVGGIKPVTPSMWTTKVLIDGQPYIGGSKSDLREVFPDFETLWAIGCESVLNIPIRHAGKVVGSLNLLDGPANYTPADIDVARLFAQLVTTAALADQARVLGTRQSELDLGRQNVQNGYWIQN
ncbi:GAF domain-containing protein [Cupriavidus sp. AcVe19-6a]|uniref:GAF domain-containing protein n=1 Tax=Cupriavidus sp. AcVe19-6a TaxID=2821358 RepID=UPI001AE723B2|nr:GAF domain-containing protein [Cupriavidus sp. AcVe19-6a]MBP0639735.1 GAF domain-containing protein [Cupriavidus sp. AcVe19-6a]